MEFEWLAALVYPRSIAVHPNFASEGQITGPSLLASEVLVERLRRGEPAAQEDTPELEFAEICIAALGNFKESTQAPLEAVVHDRNRDLGQRACAAIIVAALSLENGLPPRDLFDSVIETASSAAGPEAQLTSLWLRLGATVVLNAYGEHQNSSLSEIRLELDAIESSADVSFETTRGLNPSAGDVFDRILEFVRHSAFRWETRFEGLEGQLWVEGLRRPTPVLLAGLQNRLATGYSEWAKKLFMDVARKQTVVFGNSLLPGDDDMVTAVLVSQFAFHPFAQHAALELGRARFLRGQQVEDDESRRWAIQSALNLMRASENSETTLASVRYTLRHGPLSSLVADLDDVTSVIERRGSATRLEMDYLTEAASLLSAAQANAVFNKVFREIAGESSGLPERWVARWSRRESAMKLLGSTAGPAQSLPRFCELVANQVSAEITDEEDRTLARAVMATEGLSRDDIRPLLERLASTEGHAQLEAALRDRVGEEALAGRLPAGDQSPIERAVTYVNDVIRGARSVDPLSTSVHLDAVRAAIEGVVKSSRRGVHTMGGGIDPLDVGAAYALNAGVVELWPTIVEGLRALSVSRRDKDGALSRIARSTSGVPAEARQALAEAMPQILASEGSAFDDDLQPYPAGLRAAAALAIIDTNATIAHLGPWLSSARPTDRMRAVSVMASMPTSGQSWSVQTLLALTFDSDPDVQADALQALAHLYPNSGHAQVLILGRANDLLARDGTWLLRKVLAELSEESARPLRDQLRGRISTLTRHVDRRVRKEAAAIE